jgi:hypothetical protein
MTQQYDPFHLRLRRFIMVVSRPERRSVRKLLIILCSIGIDVQSSRFAPRFPLFRREPYGIRAL